MIPYSRPKLSDLYTLSQSKLLQNHTLHSGTYLYTFIYTPPPPDSSLPTNAVCGEGRNTSTPKNACIGG